jgi:CMP-N,N'-diacetyllegionaminic acid synthase
MIMKPICFIGARGGSKGVPNKNIRKIGGKPLIAYTVESALKSNLFSQVIVSTDSEKIGQIAKKYGASVPFLRPKKLATDNASFNDVLLHGINELNKIKLCPKIIVIRDCTVPFISNKVMKYSIELLKKEKCDTVCSVYSQHHNPYFNMMEKGKNGFLKFSKKLSHKVKNRQNAPIVYQLNGLFVIDVKKFLKYKTIIMPKILPYEIPTEMGLMIDTEFEFQIADMIAKKKIKLETI